MKGKDMKFRMFFIEHGVYSFTVSKDMCQEEFEAQSDEEAKKIAKDFIEARRKNICTTMWDSEFLCLDQIVQEEIVRRVQSRNDLPNALEISAP